MIILCWCLCCFCSIIIAIHLFDRARLSKHLYGLQQEINQLTLRCHIIEQKNNLNHDESFEARIVNQIIESIETQGRCHQCHAIINPNSKFCATCGYNFGQARSMARIICSTRNFGKRNSNLIIEWECLGCNQRLTEKLPNVSKIISFRCRKCCKKGGEAEINVSSDPWISPVAPYGTLRLSEKKIGIR
jgi:hypothetical protein